MSIFNCTFAKKMKKMKDYLSWKEASSLIRCLEKENKYRVALLIFVSLHTGMRINDILRLRWCDIINVHALCFTESRTSKNRTILLTHEMEEYFLASYNRITKSALTEYCFLSQKKNVYSVQRVNQMLKTLSTKCGIQNVSVTTNTLRKTFGRELFFKTGREAIIFLMEYFSHPSIQFTLEYLQLESESDTMFLFKL